MFIPSFLGFVFEGSADGVRVPHAVSVYHVTDPANRQSIRSQGLRPTSEVGVNPMLAGSIDGYDVDGVFVANAAQALVIAERQAGEGGGVLVYEVYLKKGTMVRHDDLMPESSLVVPGGVSPRLLKEVSLADLRRWAVLPMGRIDFSSW